MIRPFGPLILLSTSMKGSTKSQVPKHSLSVLVFERAVYNFNSHDAIVRNVVLRAPGADGRKRT
jgi:hypothetical protein